MFFPLLPPNQNKQKKKLLYLHKPHQKLKEIAFRESGLTRRTHGSLLQRLDTLGLSDSYHT